ncbi:cytochrome C peroxidase [Akkermansiaceae bacterium]|nr:cytochrome C peroxidase [Akkermansiaceae bacterium]
MQSFRGKYLWSYKWSLLALIISSMVATSASLMAGDLKVQIEHRYDGKRLALNSLSYQAGDTFSVTRLSYLLSGFALRAPDGTWTELADQYAFIDLESRRTSFYLSDVPDGEFSAVRFSIGLPKEVNHSDPASHAADHALNTNLNLLHWTWQDGYIFLALEGAYRKKDNEIGGYVYHFANDWNRKQVELPVKLQLKDASAMGISFDLQSLFHGAQPITFETMGDSTHSKAGDAIAKALKANMSTAFAIIGVTDATPPPAKEKLTPLYLPKNPQGFKFKMSGRFPIPALPQDNPLLVSRVALGEKLFHDASLSRDGTISCASCHDSSTAFTDSRVFSKGIDGQVGTRHSMPLFNLAWKHQFFWDGRASSLREQVLDPLQDPREMGETLERVAEKAQASFPDEFEKAFGKGVVTSEKVALALEAYLLSLTSYDSRFDQAMKGSGELTEEESRGFELFFTEYEPRSNSYGADCFHCHGGALFTDHSFHNNGLNTSGDYGLEIATGKSSDRYKFSTPSLRNIALTAPYMHDGRFGTLEQVLSHYNSGVQRTENLDPNLAKHPQGGLNLPQEDIDALVAFLKTLSDPKYER